jgi:hypothetical protein
MTTTQPTIKAEELRIGNWVLMQNQLEDYWPMPIEDGCEISGAEKYKPIPLTPEILEKYGFEMTNSKNYLSLPNQSHLYELSIDENNLGIHYQMVTKRNVEPRTVIGNRLQYLHQLQNLYFALTGEELQINL